MHTEREPSAQGSLVLQRGLRLLELVAAGAHDLATLSEQAETSRSTAHRLLSTLVAQGYLYHAPRSGYYLGGRLLDLGFRAQAQMRIPEIAHPFLLALSRETHETAHLGVRDQDEVLYIDKIDGERSLQVASRVGSRFPLQTTALGKALISRSPEAEWAKLFRPGLRRTARSIANLEEFVTAVRLVRQRGFALDLEENEEGVRCIAAPVVVGSGTAVAAVSIASTTYHLSDERLHECAAAVIETVQKIARAFDMSSA